LKYMFTQRINYINVESLLKRKYLYRNNYKQRIREILANTNVYKIKGTKKTINFIEN